MKKKEDWYIDQILDDDYISSKCAYCGDGFRSNETQCERCGGIDRVRYWKKYWKARDDHQIKGQRS